MKKIEKKNKNKRKCELTEHISRRPLQRIPKLSRFNGPSYSHEMTLCRLTHIGRRSHGSLSVRLFTSASPDHRRPLIPCCLIQTNRGAFVPWMSRPSAVKSPIPSISVSTTGDLRGTGQNDLLYCVECTGR